MTEGTKPCSTEAFGLVPELTLMIGPIYGVHFGTTILRFINDAIRASVEESLNLL